jgi:hypothetical protein
MGDQKMERKRGIPSRRGATPSVLLAIALVSSSVVIAPAAVAYAGCGPGGPPPGAASKDVGDTYGQPATLWITNTIVGITTAQGYGEAEIHSASPLQRSALLIDAQQDGNHQILVDAGREAILYAVSGCTITPIVDQRGESFRFDIEDRRGNGDGVGCADLGDGRRLVGLLQLRDAQNRRLPTVRRTEIDLDGTTATVGRSDEVPAPSNVGGVSCGDLTIARNGVAANYSDWRN